MSNRIKQLREAARLTQVELAYRSKLNPSTIAQLEANRWKPSFRTTRKLAEALGVSPSDIVPAPDTVAAGHE